MPVVQRQTVAIFNGHFLNDLCVCPLATAVILASVFMSVFMTRLYVYIYLPAQMRMSHAHGPLLIVLMILQIVGGALRIRVEERRCGRRIGHGIGGRRCGMMMMIEMMIQKDGRILRRIAANRWRTICCNCDASASSCNCRIVAAFALVALAVGFAARALALPRLGAGAGARIERRGRRCAGGHAGGGGRELQLTVNARLEHVALGCGAIQYELLKFGVLLGALQLLLLLMLLLQQRSAFGGHFLIGIRMGCINVRATAMEAVAAVAAANHNFRYDKCVGRAGHGRRL